MTKSINIRNKTYLGLSFILASFINLSASGQLSINRIERLLTNGLKREWQFEESDYTPTLGIKCTGVGQLFTFYADHTVEWKGCRNGQLSKKSMKWSIENVDNKIGEYQISLNEAVEVKSSVYIQKMRVDFPKEQLKMAGTKMIWRVVPDNMRQVEGRMTLLSIN